MALSRQHAFLLRFVGLAAAFYAFAWTDVYVTWILEPVARVQAALSGVALGVIGYAVQVTGNVVTASDGGFALEIRQGCDAAEATALFVAASLAYPAPWRDRGRAAAGGVALIFVLNVLRVITLYLIGVHLPRWFHFAHVDLWPALILADALVIWALWARSLTGRR